MVRLVHHDESHHGKSNFYSRTCECDTVWRESEEIDDRKGQSFQDFMVEQGHAADWKAITKVKQINGPIA